MSLRRRRLLLLGAGSAAVIVTGYGVARWYRGDPASVIVAILERRLGYLPYRYVTPYPFLKQGHSLRRLESNVVSRYLLSTDFFEHGLDQHFLGWTKRSYAQALAGAARMVH